MGNWPHNAAAVKAEWLDGVMRRNDVLSKARITGVSSANLGLGVGIMAEVSRLSIAYDTPEEGAPASIISKFPTADPTNLGVARMLFFSLWPDGGGFESYDKGLAQLRTEPAVRDELSALWRVGALPVPEPIALGPAR